jgi:putative ABC transport system permease protein
MNLSQSCSMAIKAIFNNKVRSFLTMLGIIIGVCTVIVLVTLIQGLISKEMQYYEKMGTNRIEINYYDWTQDLSGDIYDFCLERNDLFTGVTPNSSTQCTVKYKTKTTDTRVRFGSNQYDICTNSNLSQGRMLCYSDIKNRSRVVVLGSKAKQDLFNISNPIGKTIKIKGEEFRVVGVFEEKFKSEKHSHDDTIVVPYTTQRTIMKTTKIENFIVTSVSAEKSAECVEELNKFMKTLVRNEHDFYVYSQQESLDYMNEYAAQASLVLGGIAAISLLVGGIGIMNIMLVSVTERTREIGIRKAIGATRPSIITQFLIEASTISAIGGIIGIMLGSFIALILGQALLKQPIYPQPYVVFGAFAFSAFIGVFFGFYPANRASKLNPIDALRME